MSAAHLFGVFAPGGNPAEIRRMFDAMASAFPAPVDGASGEEDAFVPGGAIGLRAAGAGAVLRREGGREEGREGGREGEGVLAGPARLFGATPASLAAAMTGGTAPETEGAWALAWLRPGPQQDPGAASRAARLSLARDGFGRAPLWTAEGPGGALLFSTRPAALLAAPGVGREADPVSLAMLIAFRHPGAGRSAWAALREFPPGARLDLDAEEPRWTARAPLTPDPEIAAAPPPEAMAAIAARVRAAVHARADAAEAAGRAVGIELSGGLDSALIAMILAERGPLRGFASVPSAAAAGDLGAAGEAAARAVLRARLPGLRVEEIGPEDADFLAGAEAYRARDAAPCPDPTAFMGLHLASAMEAAGIGAAFSGMGGDFCLSSHGRPRLAEFVSRPRAAPAEIAARRAGGAHLSRILTGDLLKPSAAFRLWLRLRPGAGPEILSPAMRGGAALAARMAESGQAWRRGRGWTMAAEEIAELERLPAWPLQDRAAGWRLTPLLDRAALRAALAAPSDLRLWNGAPRGLVRRMLAETLPEIAARPDKAAFQPDFPRLQAEAVPRLRAEAAGFRDLPVWREVVDDAVFGALLDRAERAQGREALALSSPLMGAFFVGWWLARKDF